MKKNRYNIFYNKFFLKKKFNNIDYDVKEIFKNSIKKNEILKKYSSSIEEYNSILNLNKFKISSNLKKNIFLYKLLFSEGFISNASFMRNDLINKYSKKNFKTFNQFIFYLKCQIDNYDLENAYNLTNKKKFNLLFSLKYHLSYPFIKNINLFLYKLINNKHKNFLDLGVIKNENNEDNFYNLIKNKRIAIVGPGNSPTNHCNEIDKYDLVVRINTFVDHTKEEKKIFGSKTDIIYFNGDKFKELEKKGINKFQKDKFICTRINFSNLFKEKNIRSTKKLDINLIGSNGFLQDILMDLVHYEYKEIKIFNFDFYLSKKIYTKNYSGINTDMTTNPFLTHSKLDLFGNINFVRLLNKYNLLNVDENIKEIIDMNNLEISNLFYEIYKNN